jgi:hypothetical protein
MALASCDSSVEDDGFYVYSQVYDFKNGSQGWKGDFADYPVDDSLNYELTVAYKELPTKQGGEKFLMLSGKNDCKDLFMFIKKKIRNLNANSEYAISYEVGTASNSTFSFSNTGNEGVYLKVGAYTNEPVKLIQDGFFRMNLDKGNHGTRGGDMLIIGTIESSNENDYSLETSNNIALFKAHTNQYGELWLIVGADSAVSGVNSVFFTKISLVLTPC